MLGNHEKSIKKLKSKNEYVGITPKTIKTNFVEDYDTDARISSSLTRFRFDVIIPPEYQDGDTLDEMIPVITLWIKKFSLIIFDFQFLISTIK